MNHKGEQQVSVFGVNKSITLSHFSLFNNCLFLIGLTRAKIHIQYMYNYSVKQMSLIAKISILHHT